MLGAAIKVKINRQTERRRTDGQTKRQLKYNFSQTITNKRKNNDVYLGRLS